jgi:hypothetical protein
MKRKAYKKRPTFKGHSIGLRVPEKVRYGLELLSRKHQMQMSSLILRAIDKMFDDEGLNSRDKAQLLSFLDRLWSDDQLDRMSRLAEIAPQLLTDEEKRILSSTNIGI